MCQSAGVNFPLESMGKPDLASIFGPFSNNLSPDWNFSAPVTLFKCNKSRRNQVLYHAEACAGFLGAKVAQTPVYPCRGLVY